MIFKEIVWECLDWLLFCRDSDHFTRLSTLGFHKIQTLSSIAERQFDLSNSTLLSGVGVVSVPYSVQQQQGVVSEGGCAVMCRAVTA
jgi:hypothetical protein